MSRGTLGVGVIETPPQQSSQKRDFVKYIEVNTNIADLQTEVNNFIDFLINDPSIENAPAIRSVTFTTPFLVVDEEDIEKFYCAQIHFWLIGDAPDMPV